MSSVIAVSVGRPQVREWAGIGRTSIDKQNVAGPVVVHPLGLEGDQVSDTQHHGGPDQAVYAYAREDLDFWEAELGRPIRNGQFAENLTTRGLDLNATVVGTRLQVGEEGGALLEVAHVRTPCNDFKCWMGETGYDPRAWVRRFTQEARPGAYLRVLATGTVRAGDELRAVEVPAHGITVRDMFVALHTDRRRLPDLLAIENLPAKVRRKVETFVLEQAPSLPNAGTVI